MKPSLQTHIARTSNAIESYHNVLYGVILKNAPLITSLPQILQFTCSDVRDLKQFYDYGGLRPSYDRKPRKSRTRCLDKYVNDGRAPDTTAQLFSKKTDNLHNKKTHVSQVELPPVAKALDVTEDDILCILEADTNPLACCEETELDYVSPDDPSIEEELCRFETEDTNTFETDNAQLLLDQEDLHYDKDIETLDESYRDVVKEGAIITNPTNALPGNDCDNINSNAMVDDEVPIVIPSASYNLELNPNSQMSCYIDSFMELLWHAVLPHVDIEKIALESKHSTDNALLHTFKLMKMDVVVMHQMKFVVLFTVR
ncbi:hypothetical protein INT45_007362 [Circinella minor]|uniref:Uncharacterized protein n=1 Tax=Circinella minor TaxID=1195481 RepID=A0A8H7V4Z9_9FUNG|nr:hypothetical protein INT45_007362 [Circinella minor]